MMAKVWNSLLRTASCVPFLVSSAAFGQNAPSKDLQATAAAPENPQPAASAPSASTDNSTVGDIVVTAQRRSESLQSIPLAVSALGGKAISDSGSSVQAALPRLVPNLRINELSGFVSPYLRGVGTEFANAGLESSVAVYLDDVYIARPSFRLSGFADLNRVEVLKGPQGTLYGRNATGGLLRVITNDPNDKFEGKVSATYGRFDRTAFEGVLNIPVAEGVAARFTSSYDRNDGYVKSIIPGAPRSQDRNYLFLTGKILFEPTDNLKIKLSGDYARKLDREGQGWIALTNSAPGQTGILLGGQGSPGFYTTSSDYYGERRGGNLVRQYGVSARVDLTLPTVTLSSVSAFVFAGNTSYADLDTTSSPFLSATTQPARSKSYSQELQAVSNGSGPLKYVLGLYLYREDSSQRFGVFGAAINGAVMVPPGPNVGIEFGGPGQFSLARIGVSSAAPFGQFTYEISPKFDITVGARYTSETKKLKSHLVTLENLGAPIVLLNEPGRKVKFNEFTPKVTLSFKPNDKTLIYANYSKGFKSGGFNSVNFTPLSSVEPEKLTNYDVGVKWHNDWLRIATSAFYYDYKNLQVSFVDSASGAATTENAANARSYGFEAEVAARISRELSINFSGGYLHAKYRKYLGSAFVPSGGPIGGFTVVQADLSGNRLLQSPRLTASITPQYEHLLANGSKIGFNSSLSYSSRYYFDGANQISEPSRFLLSANLSWTSPGDRYRIDVFGDNLLNKKYRFTAQLNNYGGFYVPAPPITWGVKGTVRF